jgi:hypothetical protein
MLESFDFSAKMHSHLSYTKENVKLIKSEFCTIYISVFRFSVRYNLSAFNIGISRYLSLNWNFPYGGCLMEITSA